jgi:hypothetical protein
MDNFWSIKDIIMTSEEVQVITETDLEGVYFIDKSNSMHNSDITIKDQTKLKLPLWLAISLKLRQYISIVEPIYLNNKFYSILQADPIIVDLKAKSKNFYLMCLIYMNLELRYNQNGDKSEITTWKTNWQKCLINTLVKRLLFLLINSFNVLFENQKIQKIACTCEKEFYEKVVANNKKAKYYIENYTKCNNVLDNENKILNGNNGKKRKLK